MTGGSLTAAAADLMLCFCENPVFCLAAFALPGAGLLPVVPLLFSRAGRLDGVSSAAAASLISVLAYGGLLVVPPVIGLIAEQAGVEDILIVVTDGLKGMTQAIEAVFPQAQHQTCM